MTTTMPAAILEARWRARTVPATGGHLLWTGCSYLRFRGVMYKPARIAFALRTGREPVGYVLPECGLHHCVEPTHVEDQPGRQRIRAALRAVNGMADRPAVCGHGHDQATDGRFMTDGRAYCNTCLTASRTRQAAA